MSKDVIQLIVGLANPGSQYAKTRHNAGEWLVNNIADHYGANLRVESKFHGMVARIQEDGHDFRLLVPTTYMNHSGRAIKAVCQFYKIPPKAVLVAHDELDLVAGDLKLKAGGGHAGHNGLRDTISQLGSRDFLRLRIGIGHPGNAALVHDYVLGTPSRTDRDKIDYALDDAFRALPEILRGDIQQAMQKLHTKTT